MDLSVATDICTGEVIFSGSSSLCMLLSMCATSLFRVMIHSEPTVDVDTNRVGRFLRSKLNVSYRGAR